MAHSQESFIIANFVSKLRSSSPLSCDCLPQEAEFCESDADATLYERYVESGRCQKIIQCSLDALSVIREVSIGYADLHWNPGLKSGDIATFKIIYPLLRSSLDCLLNKTTSDNSDDTSYLKDGRENYDDSSTLTFEGLFLLIKTSLEFIHPLAYSCDGVVLSQLINLLDKTSYHPQLANANLSSLTTYLCRLYTFGYMIKIPENHELILRQHSVLFYRVICFALSSGKVVDPNALLFFRRVVGSLLHILNNSINDKAGTINESLVVFMSKFIDVWYGSLVKLLLTIRTNTLPSILVRKAPPPKRSIPESSSSDSDSSESSSDDDKSEKASIKSKSEKQTKSTSHEEKSDDLPDKPTPKPSAQEAPKNAGVFSNDKEQLLVKLCKLIYETPKLPPSHRMRLITQITFLITETSNNELELEALNALTALMDFSDETNSSILKTNLLPLLKVFTVVLMNKIEASGIGLVTVTEEPEIEKYVSLVYCIGQVLLNVVLFKYEYDKENVDKFLQSQINKMDPNRNDKHNSNNAENTEYSLDKNGVNELQIDENDMGNRGSDVELDGYGEDDSSTTEMVDKSDGCDVTENMKNWDQELFEMTSNTMKIFNLLLSLNQDRVDEAITHVICWMLKETNFEHTFKLAVPICCFLLRTKHSRMLEAIHGKSANHVTTTQIAISTGNRWISGSTIFKTALEYYHNKYLTSSSTKQDVAMELGEEVDVYAESATVIKTLFLSILESYLDVMIESNGKLDDQMESCLGLYFKCFGLDDYFNRMPLEKLYLVPITNERYNHDSYCFMLPVLKRQLKEVKMDLFPKRILPVLNSLDYFINKTAKLKFTASTASETPAVTNGTEVNGPNQLTLNAPSYLNKLESVHREYERVYNDLYQLCVPLSSDVDSIDVLLEDNYLVLKFIVGSLDKGPERFNTACKVISNFTGLDKVAIELIGILVKKFIHIEINMERTPESQNMCESILSAIGNVSKFCPSDLLSKNLQSFEKALNGKRMDALVKLSKALFPFVSDELKYSMYRNYLTQPKDKFIYQAIKVALETVFSKLESNPTLIKAINNSSLNAYKGENQNGPSTGGESSLDVTMEDPDPPPRKKGRGENSSKRHDSNPGKSKKDPKKFWTFRNDSESYESSDDSDSDYKEGRRNPNRRNSALARLKRETKNTNQADESTDAKPEPDPVEPADADTTEQEPDDSLAEAEIFDVDQNERELVTMIVKVNGMSELATFMEILTETIDTTKQRINCLVIYTKLLLFLKENLTKVDYSTLVALITKPLIFECVINCCTKNKNNRSNAYSIYHILCKLNGSYHHVLKVTLSTLYYNHASNKEGENVNIGIMKLLCNIFSSCYGEFDNIETLRLVVYLSGRILQCSFRFYVQLLKYFRVVMVHMNNDHLIQAAPHMMKLFTNESFANRAKIYIRRLVEKMLVRLKRDHIFTIFPKQHFPLLNNIITTRRRRHLKPMYSTSGGKYKHHKHDVYEPEDDYLNDDDDDMFEEKDDEPLLKINETVPKNKEHLLIRRRAAAAHKLKKKALEAKQKDFRYIKLTKKKNRKETVKVLKSIIKSKQHK